MKKTLLSLLLILAILGNVTLAESNEDSEKKTFTIMVPQTNYVQDVNTNAYFEWVEEQTGVEIEWLTAPEDVIAEKVNLTLTSGSLPDAFLYCGLTSTQQSQYGEEGVFLNLAPYIEEHSEYIKAAYEVDPVLPDAITMPDGGIYALAGVNACYHCIYCGRAWINQTWLDNLGLDMPTTTDELTAVLQAFKTEDANGNGDTEDEIPFLACADTWRASVYDYLMEAFTYNDYRNRLMLDDNKQVTFVANTDEWKAGLSYIRGLIEEELIDPASLYLTAAETQVITGGDDAVAGVMPSMSYWGVLGNNLEEYVALPPLKGPEGVQNAFARQDTGFVNGQFAITNACEDPETLFKWADFQFSEEATYFSSWGIKDVDWFDASPGDIGVNGEPAKYRIADEQQEGAVRNNSAPNIALANRTADFRLSQAVKDETDAEYRLYMAAKQYEPYAPDTFVPTLVFTGEEAARVSVLATQINDYVDESTAAFLNGDLDLEGDWDRYIEEFEALELEEYLMLQQTAYDRGYSE